MLAGLVFAIANPSPPSASGRHVQSRITILSRYGSDEAPYWLYITSDRNLKICPNGSGEIAEHLVTRGFPTPEAETRWHAEGEPPYMGVNASFKPGQLAYIWPEEVRSEVASLRAEYPAAGDALRRLGTLLAETVPEPHTTETSLEVARELPGVQAVVTGGQVTLSGVSGDGTRKVSLEFDQSPARMVAESWVSLVPREDLNLTVPYLIFERDVGLSEAAPCP